MIYPPPKIIYVLLLLSIAEKLISDVRYSAFDEEDMVLRNEVIC